ncbi:MAG: hypothetical protein PVG71_12310, partial [Anaerolineae bacterium]
MSKSSRRLVWLVVAWLWVCALVTAGATQALARSAAGQRLDSRSVSQSGPALQDTPSATATPEP